MLSLYSLIWTFLISCPMLLLIFILRRRSDYLTKYGVTFISILYIFCTVRMLFPIEFPSHQKVICDPYLYSFLMNLYAKSEVKSVYLIATRDLRISGCNFFYLKIKGLCDFLRKRF